MFLQTFHENVKYKHTNSLMKFEQKIDFFICINLNEILTSCL